MSADALREVVARLTTSTNALSALGLALQTSAPAAVGIQAHLDEVVSALGLGADARAGVSPAAARSLIGEIRLALLHGLWRLDRHGQRPGWNHSDPEILQAAGDVSAGFPALLQRLIPALDGLPGRLAADGARFLDVGVGVGALSIEMVRVWPGLRVVGIDVLAPALARARDNVREAGLESQIELREQPVQDLVDADTFDLAWLPSGFIPGGLIPEAIRRVRQSLKPGGWLLFAAVNPGSDPLASALVRLRTAEWGATTWNPAEVEDLLRQAGFTDIKQLPSPPGALAAFVAGRA